MGETELPTFSPNLLFTLSSHKQTHSLPPLPHLPPLRRSPNRAGPASVSVPASPSPPARSQLKLAPPLPCCWELPVPQILDSKCEMYSSASIFPVRRSRQQQCSQPPAPSWRSTGWCLPWPKAGLWQPAQTSFAAWHETVPRSCVPHYVPSVSLWHVQGSWSLRAAHTRCVNFFPGPSAVPALAVGQFDSGSSFSSSASQA